MRSDSPYAEAIAQRIKDEISNGTIPSGRPLIAERVLAERFQASRAMIRKAVAILADEGWVRAQPHCRPVVNGRDSSPNDAEPATKRDHIAVWLWPYVDDYAVSSIFRGIQKGLHGTGLRLMTATASHGQWNDVLDSERRFLQETVEDPSCAGAIVWLLGGAASLQTVREAEDRRLPIVFVDRKPPVGFEGDFVGTEGVGAAQKAIAHLVALGHRRIAHVTNMDRVSTVFERERGYRRALEDAGIPIDEELIVQPFQDQNEYESVAIDRLVQRLMRRDDPPTAVFTVNDTIALQLVDAFERAGFPVPTAVSVVGFDGLLRWIPGGGRLTTVDQDYFRIGEMAAELLQERLSQSPRTYRHVLLDAPLRVQGTTAPPRGDTDLGR